MSSYSVRMAWYLSTLYLTKGYYQVALWLQDWEKTAFATPDGLYQFTLMPFGFHGAPATFQRLVKTLLGDCTTFFLAYLDDIIIFSPTWEQHLHHLQTVLHCLQQASLHINPTKSKLAFDKLPYLGYLLGLGVLWLQKKMWKPSGPPWPLQPKSTSTDS